MGATPIETLLLQMEKEDPRGFRRALFLNELRKSLKRLRGKIPQEVVAERTKRDQSEISRVENGLTSHTRIGTLLDYIDACGGNLAVIMRDQNGEVVSEFGTNTAFNQTEAYVMAEQTKAYPMAEGAA